MPGILTLERVLPLKQNEAIEEFNEERRIQEIINEEKQIQTKLGSDIIKSGYGFVSFPSLDYTIYGYANYFMAYALYPEVIERHFSLQADLAMLNNVAVAKAFHAGDMVPLYRLDHDMADSRGTLVNISSLDKLWFSHFERSIAPLVHFGVNLIWHCDGNLMDMIPRLLETGVVQLVSAGSAL
ncbi:MAG: hypothetical protein PHP79_00580 [Clostridia bacterium]|nr:hypothetical protein [Clostridia bacterium]